MRRTKTPKLGPQRPGSDRDTARRNRLLLYALIAVIVLMIWLAGVIILGGTDQQGGAGGQSPSGADRAANEPAPSGADSSADNSGENAEDSDGAPSEQEPVDAEEVSQSLGPPSGGGVPDGEVAIEDQEGRSNGQRGFVSTFIGNAYGYTGSDVDEYLSGISGTVERGSYLASPAGQEIERYAKVVGSGGAENAAVMDDYNINAGPALQKPISDERASELLTPQANRAVSEGYTEAELENATYATVSYAIGDRYGNPENGEDFGEVYGDVDHYSQDLILVGGGATSADTGSSGLTILAGSAPRAIEDPEADMPDPDAPKVGEVPEGNHEHDHLPGAP